MIGNKQKYLPGLVVAHESGICSILQLLTIEVCYLSLFKEWKTHP